MRSAGASGKRRLVWRDCFAVLALLAGGHLTAAAHGVKAGDLTLDHPYAVPSAAGATHGKAYMRSITNSGVHADRLLGATTPVAEEVTLHHLRPHASGRHEELAQTIVLPAKSTVRLRHTGDYQLTLRGLKAPLQDGETFALTLRFERAGTQTVTVWVQTPRLGHVGHSAH